MNALIINALTRANSILADHWDHPGHWDHDGHPWFPIFPLLFVAIWIAVIIGVRRRWRHAGPRASAESVLAERYARGEIDESEFRARRTVLRDKH